MDKYTENNSITIGDKNKIKNSIIGNNSKIESPISKEPWHSKLFWKLIIPIMVVVIAAAICLWLGIK